MSGASLRQVLVQWVGISDALAIAQDLDQEDRDEIRQAISATTRNAQKMGGNDAVDDRERDSTPLLTILSARRFDRLALLSPLPATCNAWLQTALQKRSSDVDVEVATHVLSDPSDYATVYDAAQAHLAGVMCNEPVTTRLSLNLSSGSCEMSAIWVLLSHTRFPADLYRIVEDRVEALEIAGVAVGPYHPDSLHPLGNGFDLEKHLAEVRRGYLRRAMQASQGVKAHAARLLGMKHYQTLSAQLERLQVSGPW